MKFASGRRLLRIGKYSLLRNPMPLCWVQHGTDLDVALTRLLTPVPQGGEAIHRNGIKVRDLAEQIVLLRFHGQDFFLDISHHVGPARETRQATRLWSSRLPSLPYCDWIERGDELDELASPTATWPLHPHRVSPNLAVCTRWPYLDTLIKCRCINTCRASAASWIFCFPACKREGIGAEFCDERNEMSRKCA